MSEADFLAKEATDARKAISAVTHEIFGGVGSAVDPRPIFGKHPWLALSSVAVAGFVGGAMLTPSKQDAAIKKLETLSKALRASLGEKVSDVQSHTDGSDKNAKHDNGSSGGIIGMIFNHVVKPAVTATIAAKMKPSTPEHATNGSAQEPPPAEGPSVG